MARTPIGFLNAFKASRSVTDLLDRKGWTPGHVAGRLACPDYARGVEVLIERELPNEERAPSRSTLERNLRDLERSLTEPRLPYPREQIPDRPIEEQISQLEARWPEGFWVDEDSGEVITILQVVTSPELRERALELFHNRSRKLEQASAEANWELALIVNLLARIESLPLPTETEIAAFYVSREWTHVRAVVQDRDGMFCANGRTHPGPFEVHHKVSVRECWHLRFVRSNLQNLCSPCHHAKHSRKEAAE